MNRGKLWAQLAWVAEREAEAAVPDPYALPRVHPTDAQVREHRRLRAIGNACAYRAHALGYHESGLDAVFGEEER